MKKYIIPVALVVAFGFYVVFSNRNSMVTAVPQNPTEITDSNPTPPEPVPPVPQASGTPAHLPIPTPIPAPKGAYKDGSYTGPVADAFYGKIQVAVVIQGGKISKIDTPIYPNDPGETSYVSGHALPILKQEAISAQSANVDVVSGATQTSEGFKESLTAALAQAKS